MCGKGRSFLHPLRSSIIFAYIHNLGLCAGALSFSSPLDSGNLIKFVKLLSRAPELQRRTIPIDIESMQKVETTRGNLVRLFGFTSIDRQLLH